jgi:hypothetical protein
VQTVEPPTLLPPCMEKHIPASSFGISFLLTCQNCVFLISARSSRPNGEFANTIYPRGKPHNLYNKGDQYIHAFMSEFVSVFKVEPPLPTSYSTKQVAIDVFDQPDHSADYTALSTGGVQELQAVLESLVVIDHACESLSL